jgi:restriction endonuclease S subunit
MNVEVLTSTEHSLTEAGLEASSSHVVPAGSVVIATRVGLGKVVILAQDTAINQDLRGLVIRNHNTVTDRFLYWWYRSASSKVISAGTGATVQGVTLPFVSSLEVPVPPLAEQQRIVAKLDEIDSDLRTLTEHLDAEYLRSAQVRLSAVDSLFDSITAPEKPLAAVCDVFADGDWIESKDQSNTGIRLVQTGNVGDGVFKDRRDKARWIDENTFSRLNCTEVVPGDILFSRLPDPVGRACMIPDTGERMITAVDCTIARPSVKVVDPEFMVLFASSSRYFAQVRSMITGTTRDRISRKNLGDVPIPVPTLSEQKQIVLKAREIDSLCAEVSENIERRKAKAGELRQSVLAAAFRGEL